MILQVLWIALGGLFCIRTVASKSVEVTLLLELVRYTWSVESSLGSTVSIQNYWRKSGEEPLWRSLKQLSCKERLRAGTREGLGLEQGELINACKYLNTVCKGNQYTLFECGSKWALGLVSQRSWGVSILENIYLDVVLGNLLCACLLEQRNWTRWLSKINKDQTFYNSANERKKAANADLRSQ